MPRANGQVERYNKTITSAITSPYKREDGRNCDVKIKSMQYAINSIPNKTTGQTAHDLLFGFQPRNCLRNMLILAFNEDDGTDREASRLKVLKKIQKQQAEQKRRFQQRRRPPHQYISGDLVLIMYCEPVATGEPGKLHPKLQGPYHVKKSLENDRYL
ncbi:hypothetical protein QE152_g27330 [Popillia japonica]|uniref:Integrase catalytic domain-containing protein n=1 Tax=Popillia japonica TaxID=7064 RepID=A0AAW1JWK8_POPJA